LAFRREEAVSDSMEELDFQELDVACPHCGGRCSREVGQLRRKPEVQCDACGRDFTLDRDLLVCALHDLGVDLGAEERAPLAPKRH
jgi:DNA-directed RNA polymerase subunit RPC12/RpoP